MRMNDHAYYEELTALAAGGFLSDQEQDDLRKHTTVCEDCRRAEAEFTNLVRLQLPLTISPIREFFDGLQSRPDDEMRTRFLQRARREGIRLSPAIEQPTRQRGTPRTLLTAAAGAFPALIVVAVMHKTHSDRPLVAQYPPGNSAPDLRP
jgi:anti-sigma factor RsiW